MKRGSTFGLVLLIAACFAGAARAQSSYITVASTTSTEQSGLFDHLLPKFTAATGIAVRVVAQGTGQALQTAARGDADIAFVHDTEAELAFVAQGHGVERREIMYNDFILLGPRADPARLAGGDDIALAFSRIVQARAVFVSRADKSGTHAAELRVWRKAGLEIERIKEKWYLETGSGMGPALVTASALGAYILSDRGTWLGFKRQSELAILVEGDRFLFNQYGVILTNPARHQHIKAAEARRFIAWLVSPVGQEVISGYRIDGQQVFFPNARPPGT